MYKELDKYKTKNSRPCSKIGDGEKYLITFTYHESEYIADFGSLMNDFINHKNKPFCRKKYYHEHLTKLYIKMLNQIQITHWF